ncbi:MAG: DUF389 domain-containing protein [Actinomycetales bacterium]|nr:DUF389 domain-containing protein [Actinomycetales bacterium]
MLHLEICSPTALTESVVAVLGEEPTVTSLTVQRGAALRPIGDLVSADVPREAANAILHRVLETGVQQQGSIRVVPVATWVSRPAFDAMVEAPGASTDAIVWPQVVQRAYDDTELTWTYLAFMVMATLIAGIAIVLDSQILVIGAMVLGPEFGAIAALGVALLRRRRTLLQQAVRTLVIGFSVAMAITTLVSLAGRALGWVERSDLLAPGKATAFIYTPDRWSLVVSLIAGVAGVLSLTSGRTEGLAGVFISVTTIPAAANAALAVAFGLWSEVVGSSAQLAINVSGMALAGWATLWLRQAVWRRLGARGRGLRRPHDDPRGA